MTITNDTTAPLIAVVGATGSQGGSVIAHLKESDKPYRIRGLTRDASKPKAQALSKQGVQMVEATVAIGKEGEIKQAFTGADYVFAVTNFWEHFDKQREVAEGKMMVDMAKAVGVKRFIWSGLVSFSEGSHGKYTKVNHFDGKAEVTEYLRKTGMVFVDVQPGFYANNLTGGMKPRPADNGTFNWATTLKPETKLPVLDVDADYGLFVRQAIESPKYKQGGEIQAYSEWITAGELVQQLSKVSGVEVNWAQLPESAMRSGLEKTGMPAPVVEELVQQNAHFNEFGYYNGKQGSDRSDLARQPHTWAQYVREQGDWNKILSSTA